MGTSTSSTDHAQERNGHEQPTSRTPLHALTSLRFLAAMAVVLYHYVVFFAPVPAAHTEHTLWWLIASIDFPLGVDFFFVLSGFILAYSYISTSGELRG